MRAGEHRPGIKRKNPDAEVAWSNSHRFYTPTKLKALDHIGQAIARLDRHHTEDCRQDVLDALHAYDRLGARE